MEEVLSISTFVGKIYALELINILKSFLIFTKMEDFKTFTDLEHISFSYWFQIEITRDDCKTIHGELNLIAKMHHRLDPDRDHIQEMHESYSQYYNQKVQSIHDEQEWIVQFAKQT